MENSPNLKDILSGMSMRADVQGALIALAGVAANLSFRISRGSQAGAMQGTVGQNSDGDKQTALDVEADDAFMQALKKTEVRWYASEEREEIESLDPAGTLALAIDPLDGSSNINANVSIGTIFSIFQAADTAEKSVMRPGHEQLCSGYVIYGPQTMLLFTIGNGVLSFILDRNIEEFVLVTSSLKVPETATEFAINASNYRHWSLPIRAYIDDCLAGDDGPHEKNFNMRWVASLVAETHRIIMRGGIFLYPGDDRPGYEQGRLRLVYECAPIAFLIEQAGGKATDGCDRILDIVPQSLHGRIPFVFGSTEKVARVAAYHDLPPSEVSPLFGKRGLFSG